MNRAKVLNLVRGYLALDSHTLLLINAALADLFNGDTTSEDYPGFENACNAIRDAIPTGDLWIDTDSEYVTNREPDFSEEDSTYWVHFETKDIQRAFCGAELAEYL